MKKLYLLFVLMVFTACATSSVKTGPTYLDWKTGKKKFDAKIVLADTGFFTPSTADTLIKECLSPEPFIATDVDTGERHVTPNDLEDEELLAVSRCQLQADIAHDSTTGAAASFVAPVLNSAAIAYVGHEMGKGIGKSGDRTNVTNNSSNKNKADAEGGKGGYAQGGEGGKGGKGGYADAEGGHAHSDAYAEGGHAHSDAYSDADAHADAKADAEAYSNADSEAYAEGYDVGH